MVPVGVNSWFTQQGSSTKGQGLALSCPKGGIRAKQKGLIVETLGPHVRGTGAGHILPVPTSGIKCEFCS